MKSKAVFVSKDGTLLENHPVDRARDHIVLLPGVVEGLRLLHLAGYDLVVVTNQSGIAHGCFGRDAVTYEEINLRIRLATFEVPIAGFYVCPHHPDGIVPQYRLHCLCRKPKPGMLMQAACELGVDLGNSWMVGDRLQDIEAGRSAGSKTVLLTNGNEHDWEMTPLRWPDMVADTLLEAAHLIMVEDASLTEGIGRPIEAEEE